MNTLDEYDVRTGFDAMDDDKLGTIGMNQFFTLYLALGYPRLEQHQLEQYVRQTRKNYRQEVTKDMALQVLSQLDRDRESQVAALFAVVDQERNGYITAADVQRLSEQVEDPISLEEAQAMIAASNNTNSSSPSSRRVTQAKFRSVLGPPSP